MIRRLQNIARAVQGFMRGFEPWGIFLAILGLLITLTAFLIEMEDRQAERTFRAWEFVLENERVARAFDARRGETLPTYGSANAQAIVFLNREFEGRFCTGWLEPVFRWLTGDTRRRCLLPSKQRSSLESRYLREVHFGDVDLAYANFYRADLSDANLAGANLMWARLSKANLSDAMLQGANLARAILNDAVLEDANLEGADLTRARLIEADLRDAHLEGANLTRAKLKKANLRDATLRHAVLAEADLSGADLTMTDIAGARMREARKLTRQQLERACVSEGEPLPELPEDIPSIDWSDRLC